MHGCRWPKDCPEQLQRCSLFVRRWSLEENVSLDDQSCCNEATSKTQMQLTITDGYRCRRVISGMANMAGMPLTKTVKYGRNLSNTCTNMYLSNRRGGQVVRQTVAVEYTATQHAFHLPMQTHAWTRDRSTVVQLNERHIWQHCLSCHFAVCTWFSSHQQRCHKVQTSRV